MNDLIQILSGKSFFDEPAVCPLLVSVLPLRYAIAPYSGIDGNSYGLPSVDGRFPWLGSEYAELLDESFGYALRPLRDGWLYCWIALEQRLVEYEVTSERFKETSRGGAVIDTRRQAYLSLPAGSTIGMRWSPVTLSEVRFSDLKQNEVTRVRLMRMELAGNGISSGPIVEAEDKVADLNVKPSQAFNWSCGPSNVLPEWQSLISDMRECDVQAYMAVDDPWGITLDLAAMIQQCRAAYETLHAERQPDWAVAEVLKAFYEQDPNLKQSIPKLTRFNELRQTWQDHDQSQEKYEAEINRLLSVWVAWFETLQLEGLETLNTACQLFDLEQDLDRDVLELSLSLSCMGPSSSAKGAMAIRSELSLKNNQLWVWKAITGVKSNHFVFDNIKDVLGAADAAIGQKGDFAQLGHTGVLWGLNQAAKKLSALGLMSAKGGLFNAIAPAVAPLNEGRMQLFMTSLLARANLAITHVEVPVRQLREWMSDLIGTGEDARKLNQLQPEKIRVYVADIHPAGQPPAANANLLRRSVDLAKNMPFKTAILLVCGWNLSQSTMSWWEDKKDIQTRMRLAGALAGITTASTAITQELAKSNWQTAVKEYGEKAAQSVDNLGRFAAWGSITSRLQGATAALDVVIFGMDAYDAWNNADYDNAVVNAGLSGVSVGQLVLAAKMFRAFRAARAAVVAGEVAAATRVVGFIGGPLGRISLGLTITVLAGVYVRSRTKNTALENWVANTRFGLKPASWSEEHQQELIKLYQIIFTLEFHLEQPLGLNPHTGHHGREKYLIMTLVGQQELTTDMFRFKGEEIWSGSGLNGLWNDQRVEVEWDGSHFHRDIGTRRPAPTGDARYRRVYHSRPDRGEFKGIEGELVYSPQPGLALPATKLELS